MDILILGAFSAAFALAAVILSVLPFSDTDSVSRAKDWIDARTGGAFERWAGVAFLGALLVWLIGPSLLGPVADVPVEVAYSLAIALLVLGVAVAIWAAFYEGFEGPNDGEPIFVCGVGYCAVAVVSALITWGVDEVVRGTGG